MKQEIMWYGHGSWYMQSATGVKMLIDPWIEGNPACPFRLEDIRDVDIVCVTHGHSDHLGNAIEIVKQTGAILVTLPDIAIYCQKYGIPNDDHGASVHTGGSVIIKGMRIRAVHALHHADIWGMESRSDPTAIMPGSGCCGFVIDSEQDKPVYFAGDTGIFGDMALISRLYHPYVSVLPIDGKFNMGIMEASVAAEMLQSEYYIPGHYNTFVPDAVDPEEFRAAVRGTVPNAETVLLKPGETFVLP